MAIEPNLFATTYKLLQTKENSWYLGAAAVEEKVLEVISCDKLETLPKVQRLQELHSQVLKRRERRENEVANIQRWHWAKTGVDFGGMAFAIFAKFKGKISSRAASIPAVLLAVHTGYEQFHFNKKTSEAYGFCDEKRRRLTNQMAAVLVTMKEETSAANIQEDPNS
jgi:uncharacterized membrane protein